MSANRPAKRLLETAYGHLGVLILCHYNPDPDCLAAALALKHILATQRQRRIIIAYGGIIGRAENRQFIRRLKIGLTPINEGLLSRASFICLVDTQPRSGNNPLPRRLRPQVVIDHHPLRRESLACEFHDVRPDYGSSATILTEYLRELNLPLPPRLATALFYGMKSDTGNLVRSAQLADLKAFNFLYPQVLFKTLGEIESPPLPRLYYQEFAEAIERSVQYGRVIVARLPAISYPDLVGEIADFLLRMAGIKWVLVLGEFNDLLVLSVRTDRRGWWAAGKVAQKILHGLGPGGGHEKAAGGKIELAGLSPKKRQEHAETVVKRFLKAVGADPESGKALTTKKAPPLA